METAERLNRIGDLLTEDEEAKEPKAAAEATEPEDSDHHQEGSEEEAETEEAEAMTEETTTFPEMFVDVLLEGADEDVGEDLIHEVILWVKLTDDPVRLRAGLSLVSVLLGGLMDVQEAIVEKLVG